MNVKDTYKNHSKSAIYVASFFIILVKLLVKAQIKYFHGEYFP